MLGRYRGAKVDFDQTLRLDPDNSNAYYSRGQAKAGIGRYKDAIADWQASLELANETKNSALIASNERRIQEFEWK